jgi:hypothetical protein
MSAPAAPLPGHAITELIARMQAILAEMDARGDAKRHFLATYLRTTRAVQEELEAGGFLDAEWVERWDIVFAELYLDALQAWQSGEPAPEPWRISFHADETLKLPVLRHVLLGMNAHINYDLPQALLAIISDEEFADPAVVARRNQDHVHIDTVLLRRVGAEDEAISAAGGGKSLYERIKTPLERIGTGKYLQEARAKVWANTRVLAAARARGDTTEYDRLLAELSQKSAAKLDQLAHAREVVFQLWLRGFGVLLEGAKV